MEPLPLYIALVFAAATLLTMVLFYKAAHYSKVTFIVLMCWIFLQMLIALTGFYTNTNTMPPRFALLVLPPLLVIAVLFTTRFGRTYLDRLDLKALSLVHIVRIPVEVVLFWLFVHKAIPQSMTFEGRNFDVLSGLSAVLIYYFGFVRKTIGWKGLLLWNVVCLALLINVVGNGLLSAPSPFQQLSFNQPNIAILYFPFVWLPGVIVPLVLLSHLASIRQLLMQKIAVAKQDGAKTVTPVSAVSFH